MKSIRMIWLAGVWGLATSVAQELPSRSQRIEVEPAGGLLAEGAGQSVRVTFPKPIVPASAVGRSDLICPLIFEPPLETQCEWITPMIGQIRLTSTPRRTPYRAKLRPGLLDAEGAIVRADDWGVEFAADVFRVTHWQLEDNPVSDLEPTLATPISGRPKVRLEFSREVQPAEVAGRIRFLDFDTRETRPAELAFDAEGPADGRRGWCLVEPVEPLPQHRRWLLVVARELRDAGGKQLPNMLVVPLGRTEPFSAAGSEALAQPQKGHFIRIAFTSPPDAAAAAPFVRLEPAVADLQIKAEGRILEFFGKFDPVREYVLQLTAGCPNIRGVPLAKDFQTTLRFRDKRPAVIMPHEWLSQRASNGLRVELTQVNTGELTWRIAEVPPEKFGGIKDVVREFSHPLRDEHGHVLEDPKTGEFIRTKTEPLIPKFELKTLAEGRFPTVGGGQEQKREIVWQLPPGRTCGTFLVEVTGKSLDGRDVGNRSLFSLSDWAVTARQWPDGMGRTVVLRAVRMADALPVKGLAIAAMGEKNAPPVRTNADGELILPSFGTWMVLGERDDRVVVSLGGQEFRNAPYAEESETPGRLFGVIVPDRSIYHPGEKVLAKAFVRRWEPGGLTIPADLEVQPKIEVLSGGLGGFPVLEKAKLGPHGEIEFEIHLPIERPGEFKLMLQSEGVFAESQKIIVADFQPPAFSVETAELEPSANAARLRVLSTLFQGGPSVGARVRWRAEWRVAPDFGESNEFERGTFDDEFQDATKGTAERTRTSGGRKEVSAVAIGKDVTLDANGLATLECPPPFPAGFAYGRARILWMIEVVGADSQVVSTATLVKHQAIPRMPHLSAGRRGIKGLWVDIDSFDRSGDKIAGLSAKVQVYRRGIKVAKERIGDGLVKFRNEETYQPVWSGAVVTPAELEVPAEPGADFVVRVTAENQPGTPAVSTLVEAIEGKAVDVEQWDDYTLDVASVKPRWDAGEMAEFNVRAPFEGVAVVTVETNRVLERQVFQMPGNAARIRLLMKPEFAPNAFVSVHLMKPAGATGLPQERFGTCEIQVTNPAWNLDVKPVTDRSGYEPGGRVRGRVAVRQFGQPVPGAEVLVWAVDEALLYAGGWRIPDFMAAFHPKRSPRVETMAAFDSTWRNVWPERLSHFEKGYIQGDGARGFSGHLRATFEPRPLWQFSKVTDAAGEVAFDFRAPDNLTAYRVIAIAQAGPAAFGHGESLLRVSKPLTVSDSSPQIVREGDEVVLRAVLKQTAVAVAKVEVSCMGEGIEVLDPPRQIKEVARDIETVVGFRARVLPGAVARVQFSARAQDQAALGDAEERKIPVLPASIAQRVAVAGSLPAAGKVSVAELVPTDWRPARGTCNVLVSTSRLLPKLAGLPQILEGGPSLRDAAVQLLALASLERIGRSLPASEDADAQRQKAMGAIIGKFWTNQIHTPSGAALPLWPGGREVDAETTALAAFAIYSAREAFEGQDRVAEPKLHHWVAAAADARESIHVSPFVRALALLALTRSGGDDDDDDDDALPALPGLEAIAFGLYSQKAQLDPDAHALLTLAFARLEQASRPAEKADGAAEVQAPLSLTLPLARLLAELETMPAPQAKALLTAAQVRTATLRLLAQATALGPSASASRFAGFAESFEEIAASSAMLTGEDALWLLLALDSLQRGEAGVGIKTLRLDPQPETYSADGATAAWLGIPLQRLSTEFPKPLTIGLAVTYFIQGTLFSETPPAASGIGVERVVRNLTDQSRIGDAAHPFRIGDSVLLTYRVRTEKEQSFLRVTDELPAGLQVFDPRLRNLNAAAMLPAEIRRQVISPTYAMNRAREVALYYDRFPAGGALCAVVARVGAAGIFHWPGVRAGPLYDSRIHCHVPPTLLHCVE